MSDFLRNLFGFGTGSPQPPQTLDGNPPPQPSINPNQLRNEEFQRFFRNQPEGHMMGPEFGSTLRAPAQPNPQPALPPGHMQGPPN